MEASLLSRPARAVLLALVALAAAIQVPAGPAGDADASGSSTSDAARCPDLRFLPGVGDVCPRDGLYEVYSPSGASIGFTHGTDPVCDGCVESPVEVQSGTSPFCVSATPNTYYTHVIYARASNDLDRYSASLSMVRWLVGQANQLVDDAGTSTGTALDIRVLCNSGVVVVENAVLPTPMTTATFATIVSDLQAMGYNDSKQKYWVYYDDAGACTCAGTGHMYRDETTGVSNLNNGNGVPMFAVLFGANSTRTWLHELGHNLGAVQDTAPFSSRAGHCIDGRDTMCYNDGGPNSTGYSTSHCPVEVFDCNKNTYCHANPAAGSWLATHWNVCGVNQRFLHRGGGAPANVAPTMQALTCTPASVDEGQNVTCSFRATDPGNNLSYTIDWGDGSAPLRVPSSGVVPSNTTRNATRSFPVAGSYTVRVNATDDQSPPLTSTALTQTITVVDVNAAPVMASLSCTTGNVQPGANATCTFHATDDSTGVRYRIEWGDGQTTFVPNATGFVPPASSRTASHAYTALRNHTVNVTATDVGGLTSGTRNATIRVANDAPIVRTLACTSTILRPNDTATCSFNASDDSTGVRYRIDWGDGQTTFLPNATGHLAPGPTRSASHPYGAIGNYTVTVTATDNAPTPLTSAPRNATIRVEADTMAPTLTLDDPIAGRIYFGCAAQQSKLVGSPLFLSRGCVRATATDPSGVARVEVWYQGALLALDGSMPFQLEFDVPTTATGLTYTVKAYDTRGNVRTATFLADSVSVQ